MLGRITIVVLVASSVTAGVMGRRHHPSVASESKPAMGGPTTTRAANDGGLSAIPHLLVAPPAGFAALPDGTVECGRLTPDRVYPPTPTNATLRPLLQSWGFAGGFCRRWDNGTTRLSVYAYQFANPGGATQYLDLREEGVVRAHRQPGADPNLPEAFTDSIPSTVTPGIVDDYVLFPAGSRVWVVVASGRDAAQARLVAADVARRQAKAAGARA